MANSKNLDPSHHSRLPAFGGKKEALCLQKGPVGLRMMGNTGRHKADLSTSTSEMIEMLMELSL